MVCALCPRKTGHFLGFGTESKKMDEEKHSDEYIAGLRDGRLSSIEDSLVILAKEVQKLKVIVYAIYSAIGIQLLPAIKDALQ